MMAPRDPRQAGYEKRSRERKAIRAAAAFNGWVDLDVLAAFTDPDTGAFMVFDPEGTRYLSGDGVLPVPAFTQAPPPIVAPAEIPAHEFGPRWQERRAVFAKALSALDLSEATRTDALQTFEAQAAALLRGIEILRDTTGPDWREQIGLTNA